MTKNRPESARLRAWFDRLLATCGAAGVAVGLSACSSAGSAVAPDAVKDAGDAATPSALDATSDAPATADGAPPAVSRDGLELDACSGGATPNLLRGVTTTPTADYVEILEGAPVPSPPGLFVSAESGTPCATASDPTACRRTLAAATPEIIPGVGLAAVYTRGDTVRALATRADFLAFFGPVASVPNAVLVAYAQQFRPSCGPNTAHVGSDGVVLVATSGDTCGAGSPGIDESLVKVAADGTVTVQARVRVAEPIANCAVGRRPEGFAAPDTNPGATVGAYFAEAARLEAASVPAFARLARELAAHGAPAALVDRARRAQRDEVRHTRAMARLARRHGHEPRFAPVGALAVRLLETVALENAVEGCVRETFGALAATLSARRATDPVIARTMRAIAHDETEHAALAWDITAWAESRLDPRARKRIVEAREQARESLRRELTGEPAAEVKGLAGLLSAREAQALCDAMQAVPLDNAA